MNNNYDLTTKEGFRHAINALRETPVIGQLYAPYFWVADKIFELLKPGKAVEAQSKAAADLIRAGKENGAKKMKITMEEQAGLQLDVPVEGAKINVSAGSKGKVTIEVEYA